MRQSLPYFVMHGIVLSHLSHLLLRPSRGVNIRVIYCITCVGHRRALIFIRVQAGGVQCRNTAFDCIPISGYCDVYWTHSSRN